MVINQDNNYNIIKQLNHNYFDNVTILKFENDIENKLKLINEILN